MFNILSGEYKFTEKLLTHTQDLIKCSVSATNVLKIKCLTNKKISNISQTPLRNSKLNLNFIKTLRAYNMHAYLLIKAGEYSESSIAIHELFT